MSDGPRPEIFVVGAGGIGCAVGHALCTGGVEVTFVESDRAKVAWGSAHGVGLDDRPRLPARFVAFEEWRPPESAIVLLTTKCFDNDVVLARLPDSVAVMPIQNGFHRALMERSAIEGIASFVSECRNGQTHTDITRRGDLHVGRWGGGWGGGHRRPLPATMEPLFGVLERHGAFRVQRVADVLPYKYSKLMYNAAIAPLAAVAGLDNSRLLTIPKARRLFFRMLRENYGILTAAGVTLGVIGPFHPDTVDRILRMPVVARIMAWPFARSLRNTYCSMSGDIQKGRTEIDCYNGHLIEVAGDRDMPLNRRALELVRRMTKARARPALTWLDELLAPEGEPAPAPTGAM
jgi:2-dehydropantoate 2-reductase